MQGKGSIKSLFGNAVPKKKDVGAVKLEDDNILADILGELDSKETNTVGTTSHTNSSLATIQEEKNMINEYMASVSRNALKKRQLNKADDSNDDVGYLPLYFRHSKD